MALLSSLSHSRALVRWLILFTLLAQMLLLSACGTIMLGSTQQIGVSSVPTGARVTVGAGWNAGAGVMSRAEVG